MQDKESDGSKLVEIVARAIRKGGCDANGGGDHDAMKYPRDNYAFCVQCGETIPKGTVTARQSKISAQSVLTAIKEAGYAVVSREPDRAFCWAEVRKEYPRMPDSWVASTADDLIRYHRAMITAGEE